MSQAPDRDSDSIDDEYPHPTGKPPELRLRIENRLWVKVDWDGKYRDECWKWREEHALSQGYGILGFGDTTINAHRLAYELDRGIPPGGLDDDVLVRHLCAEKRCCNPSHLTAGDHYDNRVDAVRHGDVNGLRRYEVTLIKAAYPDLPQRVIADRFGVTQQAISNIVRGERHATR